MGINIENFYSIILFIAGVLFIYFAISMKASGNVPRLMVNEADQERMDLKKYASLMWVKTLIFGVICLVFAILDLLVISRTGNLNGEMIFLLAFIILLLWFAKEMSKVKRSCYK